MDSQTISSIPRIASSDEENVFFGQLLLWSSWPCQLQIADMQYKCCSRQLPKHKR